MRRVTFAELMADRILAIGDGYRAKNDELGGDGPIFLRAGKLTPVGFDWACPERFQAHLVDRVASKVGRASDTVITTKGNSVGRAGFVPLDAPTFVYSPHLSYWRSTDETQLSPGFLRYWAQGSEFRDQLRALAHGTDMAPYLSLADQHRLTVSLPAIESQRTIGATLGALDNKIESNRRTIRLLRDLAIATLVAAAVDDYVVGDVADVRKGISYKGDGLTEEGKGLPMVNMGNAENFGWLKRSGFKYYNLDYRSRHVALPESLIITSVEQTWNHEIIGWPLVVPDDAGEVLFTHHMLLVDFHESNRWMRLPLWAHLFTPQARASLEGMVYGTTVATLPVSALESMSFGAPAQSSPAIETASWMLRRAWSLERESASLANVRDALLPELLSGRMRVPEAAGVVS